MILPEFKDILSAANRIGPYVKKTPVLTSSNLNELAGCNLFFKCENFQKAGAFKFRGATNSIMCLGDEEAVRGVATHSSGNFAQALALAASIRNIPATIVMPDNAPAAKVEAVRSYNADIIFCEPTLEARESTLKQIIEKNNAIFLHPYDNFNVICGQGTAALELINDEPALEILITPVGGGGLLAGSAIAAKSLKNNIEVYAAEPSGADDAYKSLEEGKIIASVNPKTICDGLLTSLGELNFPIIQKYVNRIITVDDEFTIMAMKLIWERMKIVVEPSAAITLGAVLANKDLFTGKKAGIILSGGNLDLNKLPWML